MSAEHVADSEKLLCTQLDLGPLGKRQVTAGRHPKLRQQTKDQSVTSSMCRSLQG